MKLVRETVLRDVENSIDIYGWNDNNEESQGFRIHKRINIAGLPLITQIIHINKNGRIMAIELPPPNIILSPPF